MIIGQMTLAQIRAKSPCRDGWAKLLASLKGRNTPLDTVVSLGDVVRSNGAADAWWCVRALDWSDIATRRAVIGALLPSVRRASKHTTDTRVYGCIEAVARWCAGDDTVDLSAAARAAWAARAEEAAEAAGAAADAAARAAWAAAAEAAAEAAADAAAWAAAAEAAEAAGAAAWAAARAAAWAAAWAAAAEAAGAAARAAAKEIEYQQQAADLIAAFPPLH